MCKYISYYSKLRVSGGVVLVDKIFNGYTTN